MIRDVELNFQPSSHDAVAWSDDGEIALAAGENIHLLIPNRRRQPSLNSENPDTWIQLKINVCWFTEEEWATIDSPRPLSNFTIGEEQGACQVAALAWSPSGLGKYDRPALGVLTTNGILSIWTSDADMTLVKSWKRTLIANKAPEKYGRHFDEQGFIWNSARIRAFAWRPMRTSPYPGDGYGDGYIIATMTDDSLYIFSTYRLKSLFLCVLEHAMDVPGRAQADSIKSPLSSLSLYNDVINKQNGVHLDCSWTMLSNGVGSIHRADGPVESIGTVLSCSISGATYIIEFGVLPTPRVCFVMNGFSRVLFPLSHKSGLPAESPIYLPTIVSLCHASSKVQHLNEAEFQSSGRIAVIDEVVVDHRSLKPWEKITSTCLVDKKDDTGTILLCMSSYQGTPRFLSLLRSVEESSRAFGPGQHDAASGCQKQLETKLMALKYRFGSDHHLGDRVSIRNYGVDSFNVRGDQISFLANLVTFHPSEQVEYKNAATDKAWLCLARHRTGQAGEMDLNYERIIQFPWEGILHVKQYFEVQQQIVTKISSAGGTMDGSNLISLLGHLCVAVILSMSDINRDSAMTITAIVKLIERIKTGQPYVLAAELDLFHDIAGLADRRDPDETTKAINQMLVSIPSSLIKCCEIPGCGQPLLFQYPDIFTAKCPGGHQYARCSASLSPIQQPYISKRCEVCNRLYLDSYKVKHQTETEDKTVSGPCRFLCVLEDFESCLFCGGKFLG